MIPAALWYDNDNNGKTPIYVRLYYLIRNEIEKGNIKSDHPIPSIRKVANELGISTTTVENAYNQLMVEGYIYSIPKKGYYASRLDQNFFSSNRIFQEDNQSPECDNSDTHYLDTSFYNFREWKRIYSQVLEDLPYRLLTEGDPQGETELRLALSEYVYNARGVFCKPDQIVIGSGVQTLLNIFCDIPYAAQNKKIAFEEPGFVDVRPVFEKRGFSLYPVKLDKDGIHVETLYETEASTCYISPSHQFPTGLVMPVRKRMGLLVWANDVNGYILEDDYDSELRFSGRPVPSLFSLDNNGCVVYIGSFSTLLAPSLRISYMILPETLQKGYQSMIKHYRSTVSTAEQLALARYISEGLFEKHLRRVRKKCSVRLKAFLSEASKYRKILNIYTSDTGIFVLLKARDSKVSEKIREFGAMKIPGLRPLWENFFALQYAMIPEDKYPQLFKELLLYL